MIAAGKVALVPPDKRSEDPIVSEHHAIEPPAITVSDERPTNAAAIAAAARAPAGAAWAPAWIWAAARLSGPLAGGILAVFLARSEGTPLEAGGLAILALLAGALIMGREPGWSPLLPFMATLARASGPLLGAFLLLGLEAADALPGLGAGDAWLIGTVSVAVSLFAGMIARPAVMRYKTVRIAVIGSNRSTDSLGRELRLSEEHRYEICGRITWADDPSDEEHGEVPVIGTLDDLGAAVAKHEVDLLLMTGEPPRMAVFEEVARSCLNLPVRLRELSGFYEEVFGHVAVAEINAAWFQWIVHPNYRAKALPGERALDLIVAGVAGLVALPLVGIFAFIIKRDGGPALFSQVRIGEGGKPFTIYKLRTMREGANTEWATADDMRVTRIGHFLRRTHLDELPQVVNVLRGEMSVVGPRPEQPGFVDRLERVVPFYQRRHLMKPGLTGWAQVRCGYAGSDIGSAWKVCHDLYYLKHRSIALNLVILGETLRTLVADPQYSAQPASVDFILAPTRTPLDGLDTPQAAAAAQVS